MALARVQYTQAVAGNKNFTVPMPYISRDHIHVSVNGADVGFSWLNDTTVQLDTAPAEGDVIDLRRETERVNLLVDFQDASTITEEQLDLSAKQAFFIAQEAFDATGGTMAVANDGSYSANNRRISNLGDPDSDDDAANVRWVKQQYTDGKNAYQERLMAEAARDAAQASETASATSESNALSYRNTANSHRIAAANSADAAAASEAASAQSEANAAASAAAAKASEDDVAANAAAAASSEANALTYKNSAAASASSASSNATSAGNSAAKASQWAELPEDTTVEPGKYSAKHHAAKAGASAASASMSATNAANYRNTANSHRLAAANSAAEAANSEANALSYRNTANSHRQAAANSAAEAAGYAAGVNLPSAQGNGGMLLRQKLDESGLEYFDGDARFVQLINQSANIEYSGDGGLIVRTGNNDGRFILQAQSSGQAARFTVQHGAPELKGHPGGWYIDGNPIYHAGNRQKPQRTVLWSGRVGAGNISLSQRWDNFDYLIFLGSDDAGDWLASHRVDVADIKYGTVSDAGEFLIQIRAYWKIDVNSYTSLVSKRENGILFRVIGGYY
jgi:hypothetical protein